MSAWCSSIDRFVSLHYERGEIRGNTPLSMGLIPFIPLLIKIHLLLDLYFRTYERGCQVQVSYYKRERIRVYLF